MTIPIVTITKLLKEEMDAHIQDIKNRLKKAIENSGKAIGPTDSYLKPIFSAAEVTYLIDEIDCLRSEHNSKIQFEFEATCMSVHEGLMIGQMNGKTEFSSSFSSGEVLWGERFSIHTPVKKFSPGIIYKFTIIPKL